MPRVTSLPSPVTHWTHRILLVEVLVDGDWSQGQPQFLLLSVGQPPLMFEGVNIPLDPKHQVQEGLDQHTQGHKAQESKNGWRDQGEEKHTQCEGIEDRKEGHEFHKRIQNLTNVAHVLLFLFLEDAVVPQKILDLAQGTKGGGGSFWFFGGGGGGQGGQ